MAASFVTVFQFRAVPSFGVFSFDGPWPVRKLDVEAVLALLASPRR